MNVNEKKSTYGKFINKDTQKSLVYYPCPKNANTSAKLFFLKHLGIEKKFIFIGDKIPRYKQTKKDLKGKINIVSFLINKQPFSKIDADVKCCIIRDPLERFISAYKNRILYHKDSEFYDHSIDMIIDKLESNYFDNKHFLPQSFFLGQDLNYYNFFSNVTDLKSFENGVNEFFNNKIQFPKLQTSGKNLGISLTKIQINKIKKIYSNDYDLFEKKYK